MTTATPSTHSAQQQRPLRQEQRAGRLPGPPLYTAVGNTLRFLRHALDFSVWPVTRAELAVFQRQGLREVAFEDRLDWEEPPVRRFRVHYSA